MIFMNYNQNTFINILEIENYYSIISNTLLVWQKRIFELLLSRDKSYVKINIIHKLYQYVENKSNIAKK